jgi:hypothetical protein
MSLEARTTEPGLWVNPAWQAGTPGTFAVIIGVSAYPHLAGGEAEVPETFGLGQLRVSALTAYEMFRWLGQDYRVDGCPLAMCWLLLSPTAEERAYAPNLADNLTLPTFDRCKQALRFWHFHMQQLPQTAAETSRALFFFSGHGLEVHQEHQVLLPNDYLAPPGTNWNDAISTDNLKKGLASLGVARQFFFLDACRNDHHALRSKKVTGTEILPEDESALVNPILVAPLLYATASGQQAFQQPTPQQGLSLFGRALLDGLLGTPDIKLYWQEDIGTVSLFPLQGYVKQRVIELLRQAGAQMLQPVKLSGIVDDEAITYLARAAVASLPTPPPLLERSEALPIAPPGAAPTARERSERITRALDITFSRVHDVAATLRRSVWSLDFGIGHRLFEHEDITAVWSQQVQIYALQRQRWLPDPDALVLHRVALSDGSYRIECSIAADDPLGYWLEIVDPAGVTHGCVLPTDQSWSPRYLLEFDITSEERGARRFRDLQASLAQENPDFLSEAARLWQRYRTADVGEAVEAFETSVIEQMVQLKLESPLAATVASLILLRANRLPLLHDWVRNLANWFEARPDGAALWAEQVMRQQRRGVEAALTEAATYLTQLLWRGLPHTSEGFAYAARLCDTLRRLEKHLPDDTRTRLEQLGEHFQTALVSFSPGGLFTTYSGFAPQTDPTTLLGPFAARH